MKIYIDNKIIAIIFENKIEETTVKEYFTWADMSKVFSRGMFDAKKIRNVCFVKKMGKFHILFSGFLQELIFLIKKENIALSEFQDKRTKYKYQLKKYTNEELEHYFPFDYNKHETDALRKLLKINCGIVKVPTGGGKGDILVSFIKEIKLPTLVMVNKISLAEQLASRAIEAGLNSVGVWNSKKKINGDILFSTIGSFGSIPSLAKYKILCIDEVHHASSKTFQDFLAITNFPVRLGFSATPNKGNGYEYALVRQYLGDVIAEVDAEELMKNKVIVRPKIIFHKVECTPTLDWPSAYELGIIKNEERNRKIAQLVEEYDIPTLILIKDVKYKQGEIIKEYIENNTNKKVVYMSGSSNHDRQKVLEDFENGLIDILISTNILNEGVSIKSIKLLINASGGKSKVENLQKLGRGVRIKEDKKEVIIIDFYDNGNRFTQIHSEIREKIYKKEGYLDIVHIG